MLWPQISNFVHIKGLVFCILTKVSINFQNISKHFFHPLFQENQESSHCWHDSGAVATITQPTKILLSRCIAGFVTRPSSLVWQGGERRTTFWAKYAFRRVLFSRFGSFYILPLILFNLPQFIDAIINNARRTYQQ